MALVNILTLLALAGGEAMDGYAPHYAPGLMARVSRNRDMPPVGCMVSSPVYPVGTWVYVYGKATGVLRYCRVTDVSQPVHRQGHIDRKRWVELSFDVTADLCGSTRGRSVDCPILVIRLEEYHER